MRRTVPRIADRGRLRFGPHAGRRPEQVVLRDPAYVVDVLAHAPQSVLADILRGLIADFDAQPLACPCARCGSLAQGVCAYPASTRLFGYCERCVRLSPLARPLPAVVIAAYEDALRHVQAGFARGRRGHMRRIIGALALCKGGPKTVTEAAARTFFGAGRAEPSRGPPKASASHEPLRRNAGRAPKPLRAKHRP